MQFTKMHGIGNDYIYVNCFKEKITNPSKLAVVLSNRHTGIGGDGLILICPSKTADARMRIFNADGSEAEMCGNGLRCVAKYVFDHNLAKPGKSFSVPGKANYPVSLKIETNSGILTVGLKIKNKKVQKVCVNMGNPKFAPDQIPVNLKMDRVINEPIEILGREYLMTCVSIGNPHAVFFCENVDLIELTKVGPIIENLPIFPKRTNVHFIEIISKNELKMRSWERGSGITLACGTGACASLVAAVLCGNTAKESLVHLPGGNLEIFWSNEDNCVYMAGPAEEVFEGVWQQNK